MRGWSSWDRRATPRAGPRLSNERGSGREFRTGGLALDDREQLDYSGSLVRLSVEVRLQVVPCRVPDWERTRRGRECGGSSVATDRWARLKAGHRAAWRGCPPLWANVRGRVTGKQFKALKFVPKRRRPKPNNCPGRQAFFGSGSSSPAVLFRQSPVHCLRSYLASQPGPPTGRVYDCPTLQLVSISPLRVKEDLWFGLSLYILTG